MAKKKFELSTLDVNNIQELDGWKEKQENVVKDNPFIEITDASTYETAKQRRTALVSARTEIQKQDTTIGTVVSRFRKETKRVANELIEITQPHEEKQQEEVRRWEKILDDKKREKELAEQNRVSKINDQIDHVKKLLSDYIDLMTYDNLEDSAKVFEDEITTALDFDYEEFQPMIDEVIKDKTEEFNNEVARLRHNEELRIEGVKKEQASKIDQLYRQGNEMIDQTTFENVDNLRKSIDVLFNIEFDFGDYDKAKNETHETLKQKANLKIKWIENEAKRREEITTQENRNRIINVREGLLDKIFQMDPENYVVEKEYIENALDQDNPFPDLQDEYEKMIEVVKKNFDQKKELVESQIQKQKEEEKQEEERMEKVLSERIATLKGLGMVEHENGHEFYGFGLKYDVSQLYEVDDISELIDEINTTKEAINFINDRTKARGEALEVIGFTHVEQQTEDFWGHPLLKGFEVWKSMVEGLTDETWVDYYKELQNEVKTAELKDKQFQERQQRLDPEKEKLIGYLESVFTFEIDSYSDLEDFKPLFEEMNKSFGLFVETLKNKIEKF